MIIKEIRESAGLTKKQLADHLGCSTSKIYDIEHGRRNLNPNDLERLSEILAEKMDLAYVAGLFDRASTITIARIKPYKIHDKQVSPTYMAKIQFHSKHKILCEIIKNVFKSGLVSTFKSKTDELYYQYYAVCNEVDDVLEKLLPYIKLKRNKVVTLIEFRSFMKLQKGDGWHKRAIQDTSASEWWSLTKTAANLNRTAEYLGHFAADKRLIARKVLKNDRTRWEVAPITNIHEVKMASGYGHILPQEVVDKYEEYYQRIRE